MLADWARALGARSIAEVGLLPSFEPQPTGSFWVGIDSSYRLPVLIAYLALVIVTMIWPAGKNLAELIALSAAVLVASQFWYLDKGGTLVLLYLPLAILMMFRPTITRRKPIATPLQPASGRVVGQTGVVSRLLTSAAVPGVPRFHVKTDDQPPQPRLLRGSASSSSTPADVPITRVSQRPRKSPVSKTPTTDWRRTSSSTGSIGRRELAIDDRVAAVGEVDVRRPEDAGSSVSAPSCWIRRSVCFSPTWLTSTGIGAFTPEPIDALILGDHGYPPARPRRPRSSRGARAPPALDHPELGVDLIGTVEVQVQPGHVVELPERDAQVACQFGRRDAGRDPDDPQGLERDPLAQPLEHQGRGRARAQPTTIPDSTRFAAALAARTLAGSLSLPTGRCPPSTLRRRESDSSAPQPGENSRSP